MKTVIYCAESECFFILTFISILYRIVLAKTKKYYNIMKKNFRLTLISLVGFLLVALYLCSRWNEKIHEDRIVFVEDDEVVKPQVRNVVNGYRRGSVILPKIPKETPTDEGFLSVEGSDSIELCTDIMSGYPYRIIIETARQTPLCKLLNEMGDSVEWDYAAQAIKFSTDSMCVARLLVADKMFPFGISENLDSIPETRFCNVTFAELANNSSDSIHSAITTRFPFFGSGAILFCTASQQSNKLYLKVVHPGLLNVAVVYDQTVCGYPLFWDNETAMFEDGSQQEIISTDDYSNDTLWTDF